MESSNTATAVTRFEMDVSNFTYDLFVSYRRKDGLPFARWLRQKLLSYRLPQVLGERSKLKLRVYQDTAYERATEDFWSNSVLPALLASRYLGVVLTPGALEERDDGKPNWVRREIEAFTATPQGGNVFVLRGIDCASESLPGDLQTKFPNIEQIDLRDLQSPWNRVRRRSTLRDRLLTVAATLYDVPPEEMPIIRREEEKRKRRVAWTAAMVSLALLAVMSVLAIGWLFQRNQARQQRDLAQARQLAAESTVLLDDDPKQIELSLLLATESMRRHPLRENDMAVRRELKLLLKLVALPNMTGSYIAAFGPDSRFVVVISNGGKIARLLELPSGKELLRLDHSAPIDAFALSPDGHYLATSCAQCSLRVFDTDSGKDITQLSNIPSSSALAFSPDGKYLAQGGNDKAAHIFETSTWKQVSKINQPDAIESIRYSPDGKVILIKSDHIRVFDVATGTNVTPDEDFEGQSIDLGPDKQYIVSDTSRVMLVDAASGKERAIPKTPVRTAAFSPDGSSVAACGSMQGLDKTCWIFRLPSLEALRSLPPNRNVVGAMTYSPDSRFIATSSAGIVRIFEVATGDEVGRVANQQNDTAVLFSPDSSYVATAQGGIYALSRDHLLTVQRIGHAHVALSGDGRYLARPGQLQVFETSTGSQIFQGTETASVVALSDRGDYVATETNSGDLSVFEVQSGRQIVHQTYGRGITPVVVFSPDGKLLASSFGAAVRVLDLSGKELQEFSGLGRVRSLAFSADSSYLGIGTEKRVAIVYKLPKGEEILRVTHGNNVHAVAFSPDGRYFASGSLDNTVPIYDLNSRKEVLRLTHEESIFAIAFSPDSRLIATGGLDATVRVSDLSGGSEVTRFTLPSAVRVVVFSQDGGYLTIASGDEGEDIVVTRCILGSDALINEACARLTRNLTPEESREYLGEEIPPKTCNGREMATASSGKSNH